MKGKKRIVSRTVAIENVIGALAGILVSTVLIWYETKRHMPADNLCPMIILAFALLLGAAGMIWLAILFSAKVSINEDGIYWQWLFFRNCLSWERVRSCGQGWDTTDHSCGGCYVFFAAAPNLPEREYYRIGLYYAVHPGKTIIISLKQDAEGRPKGLELYENICKSHGKTFSTCRYGENPRFRNRSS